MKIEFNQTTVTIAACIVMAVFMFGKDLVSSKPSAPQRNQSVRASANESSEARFKRENRDIVLPTDKELSPEAVQNKIAEFGEVPFGDTELEYSVSLPKSWVKSNFAQFGLPGEEKYLILTNIARYFGPAIGDVRPYLWIEAVRLKREVTARDFMHGYFANRGLSSETERINSEKDAEALFVEVENQGSYAVHGRFIIHGDTLVLVKMAVPVLSYKDLKNLSGYVVTSFDLKNSISRKIEQRKTFKLLNVLSFEHLGSWTPAHVERKSTLKTGMELHNLHKDGGLNGVIYIKAYRKTANLDESTIWPEITEFLSGRGFSILEEKENDELSTPSTVNGYDSFEQKTYDVTFKELLKKSDFDIERGDDNIIRQTMHISRFDNGNYVTYALLITPDNSKYYTVWAQNMFAYNLLLKTLDIREKDILR